MAAGAASESQRYSSCTTNTVMGNEKNKGICSIDSREKVPETTFCLERG